MKAWNFWEDLHRQHDNFLKKEINMKWKLTVFLAGIMGFSSLSSYADTSIVLAGSGTQNNSQTPLIALGTNHGESWVYPEIKNRPAVFSTGDFLTDDCKNNFCVAAGLYYPDSEGDPAVPLVASSQDHGVSWSYVPLLSNLNVDGHPPASCNNTFCAVAFDKLTPTPPLVYPFIEIWNQKANTWSLAHVAAPKDISEASLSDISCNENICSAVGAYSTVHTKTPGTMATLLLVSTDQGLSWTTASFKLPADTVTSGLNKVQCFENSCIAVGVYVTQKGQEELEFPLIVTTNDKGVTWNAAKTSAFPINSYFNSIKCYKDRCMVVGKREEDQNNPLLLAVSKDQGKTWSVPPTINSKLPAELRAEADLDSVACNDHLCIASGDSIDPTKNGNVSSIFFMSLDKGATWSFIDTKLDEPFFRALDSYCDETDCMFFGVHGNGESRILAKPFELLTHDNGSTWNFANLNLPTDYSEIWFYGAPSATNLLYKFMHKIKGHNESIISN